MKKIAIFFLASVLNTIWIHGVFAQYLKGDVSPKPTGKVRFEYTAESFNPTFDKKGQPVRSYKHKPNRGGRTLAAGNKEFYEKTKPVFQLIKEKTPEYWEFLNDHAYLVRQGRQIFTAPPNTIFFSHLHFKGTPRDTPEYKASVMMSELFHLYAYNEHIARHGIPPPHYIRELLKDEDTNRAIVAFLIKEEKAAGEFQIGFLKRIGADQSYIDHVRKQKGDHFDSNGNGLIDPHEYAIP